MTIGVTIPAMLPNMLKMEPDKPMASFGDVSATTAHPRAPMPLPKNASDINATTIQGAYTADSGAGGVKVVRVFNIDDAQAAGPGGTGVRRR